MAQAGAGAGATTAALDADRPYTPPEAGAVELRARTWRLAHAEYASAVQQLLGVTVDVSDLEAEIDNGVYPNMSASGIVRGALATGYYAKAEQLADRLTAQQLSALIPGRKLDASAKSTFVQNVVARAFRRPATPQDLDAFSEIFDLGVATTTDGTGGFRSVVRAVLTSPFFLYRTEIGTDPAATKFTLTDHEVASLLSFSLLGAPPSEALLAAAATGQLTKPEMLAQQVRMLLAAPEATARLTRFMTEWLKVHHFADLDKDAAIFPGFEAVRSAMQREATDYLSRNGAMAGTLAGLLTTPLAPSGALAEFYRSEPSSRGQLGTRTGVLGLGAVVAARAKPNTTSPTLRGLFVRERFLCQEIHLPANLPPDIVETLRRSMPRTTRELYSMHASNTVCASCHSMLDPLGFNFEDLDAAGRFRTAENGVPVDTSGSLVNADVNVMTADHTELARALAQSEWVRECMARQAFRFYFGQVETDRGVPAVQAGRRAIGDGTLRDMLAALMSSATTTLRVRN